MVWAVWCGQLGNEAFAPQITDGFSETQGSIHEEVRNGPEGFVGVRRHDWPVALASQQFGLQHVQILLVPY